MLFNFESDHVLGFVVDFFLESVALESRKRHQGLVELLQVQVLQSPLDFLFGLDERSLRLLFVDAENLDPEDHLHEIFQMHDSGMFVLQEEYVGLLLRNYLCNLEDYFFPVELLEFVYIFGVQRVGIQDEQNVLCDVGIELLVDQLHLFRGVSFGGLDAEDFVDEIADLLLFLRVSGRLVLLVQLSLSEFDEEVEGLKDQRPFLAQFFHFGFDVFLG